MNVIQRQNFHARMANVFQSYGSAILTMIVEMILMNLLTFAETAIVLGKLISHISKYPLDTNDICLVK